MDSCLRRSGESKMLWPAIKWNPFSNVSQKESFVEIKLLAHRPRSHFLGNERKSGNRNELELTTKKWSREIVKSQSQDQNQENQVNFLSTLALAKELSATENIRVLSGFLFSKLNTTDVWKVSHYIYNIYKIRKWGRENRFFCHCEGKIFLCTELIITFYEMSKDLCSGDCLSLESGYNTNMLHFVHNLGFRVLVLELVQWHYKIVLWHNNFECSEKEKYGKSLVLAEQAARKWHI